MACAARTRALSLSHTHTHTHIQTYTLGLPASCRSLVTSGLLVGSCTSVCARALRCLCLCRSCSVLGPRRHLSLPHAPSVRAIRPPPPSPPPVRRPLRQGMITLSPPEAAPQSIRRSPTAPDASVLQCGWHIRWSDPLSELLYLQAAAGVRYLFWLLLPVYAWLARSDAAPYEREHGLSWWAVGVVAFTVVYHAVKYIVAATTHHHHRELSSVALKCLGFSIFVVLLAVTLFDGDKIAQARSPPLAKPHSACPPSPADAGRHQQTKLGGSAWPACLPAWPVCLPACLACLPACLPGLPACPTD